VDTPIRLWMDPALTASPQSYRKCTKARSNSSPRACLGRRRPLHPVDSSAGRRWTGRPGAQPVGLEAQVEINTSRGPGTAAAGPIAGQRAIGVVAGRLGHIGQRLGYRQAASRPKKITRQRIRIAVAMSATTPPADQTPRRLPAALAPTRSARPRHRSETPRWLSGAER